MAAHLPVISTLLGGSAELVREGENALQFAARDPVDLARAINRLAGDPDLRKSMVETAGREVVDRYDIAVIVGQIEAYLQETLHLHGHP